MIKHRAVVTEISADKVWTTAIEKNCDICSGCSVAVSSRRFTHPKKSLLVDAAMPLKTGETVIVGVKERELLGWSTIIYLLPLIGFFSGAILGRFVAGNIAFSGENLIVLTGGIVGFILVVRCIRKNSFLKSHQLRPVVVRKG